MLISSIGKLMVVKLGVEWRAKMVLSREPTSDTSFELTAPLDAAPRKRQMPCDHSRSKYCGEMAHDSSTSLRTDARLFSKARFRD